MLSALTLADHPGHTAAAFHVARSPLAAVLGVPPDLHARPAECAALSNALRRGILVQGYAGVLADWAARLAPYGPERTARRLEQVLDLAAEFDALPPMRASEFVRAVRDASVENPGAAPVRVMTINRAKGLEFDAVFLPELDWKAPAAPAPACSSGAPRRGASDAGHAVYQLPQGAAPPARPRPGRRLPALQDEEITGLLCLLYVALTRARHALHLYVKPAGPGLTPAALLRHGLGGTPSEDGRLHVSGDASWHQHVPWPEVAAPSETPARPAFQFARATGARRRGPSQGALSLGVTTAEDHLCLD